jgi:hypothetical protein
MSDEQTGWLDLKGTQVNPRDLGPLVNALTAAGVSFRSLGVRDNKLHTYDESGDPIPLPELARAIVDAYVAPTPPPTQAKIQADAIKKAKSRIDNSPDLTPAIKAALGGALSDILAGLGVGGAG